MVLQESTLVHRTDKEHIHAHLTHYQIYQETPVSALQGGSSFINSMYINNNIIGPTLLRTTQDLSYTE
ncbi:MAG: hypothetical protein IPP52_14250 [Ignavibacteria bacterium]|nr:hypothetical protein [Ignavibacteria bacterium]